MTARAVLGGLGAAVLLAALFLWLDRSSLERGNRLFRQGRTEEAAEVYRSRLRLPGPEEVPEPSGEGTGDTRVAYNLGTALLARGSAEAARHLEDALRGEDTVTIQRAHYNLGYELLGRVRPGMGADSALLLLDRSVIHYREALFLDPESSDARWNLALARRSLDSLLLSLAGMEATDVAGELEDGIQFDSGSLTRAEESGSDALPGLAGTEPDPETDPSEEDTGRQTSVDGAREAAAGTDEGRLSREEALRTLESFGDDPELLVRGILWIQRPDVNWWETTPYPGGDW